MNIRNRIKELRTVMPDEVSPNPRNWRKHPQAQRSALRGVLAEVGIAAPVIAYETPTGLTLIDGHERMTIGVPFPCVILDVTEAEANTLLATIDPLGAMAEADSAALDALLREVSSADAAVMQMLADLAAESGIVPEVKPGAGGDEFDTTPEESGPTRCQPGDLWVIGGKHRLIIGDCTDPAVVARLMGGEKPFLMVTDPPYGVEYDPNWRRESNVGKEIPQHVRKNTAIGKVKNDNSFSWIKVYEQSGASVAYVWCASLFSMGVAYELLAADYDIRALIIWRKPNFVISRGHYHWQHEPCWYTVRRGETALWCGDRKQSTVWDIASLQPMGRSQEEGDGATGHSTQKPIECMARPMRNHGEPGDLVYDPFIGSGTTLIAAHRTGRRCFGCEIEPKYGDVILRRAEAEGLTCEHLIPEG